MTDVDMGSGEQQAAVGDHQDVGEAQVAAQSEPQATTTAAPGKAGATGPDEEPWRKR